MLASDLEAHMRKVGTWVDWEKTVDTFKAGDPNAEVKGIAVGWMSLQWALEKAHAAGCNLVVTHEPTFYDHWDRDPSVFEHEHARRKRAFLAETGMVVYRCHDVWDAMPEVGIPDSWGKGLDLGGRVVNSAKFYRVYEREPLTVEALAGHVLQRVRPLGQEHVDVVGDPAKVVSRVAIGTGAITDVVQMVGLGADALIVTDDGIRYWKGGSWALDAGLPLLVVNHATAEEWGMQSLTRYLREQFPEVPIRHIPEGCMYRAFA